MSRWKHYLPVGVQDYLMDECYNKLIIQNKLRKLFFLSGYDEIETPVLEYFDVFTGVKASVEQEQMFKLFDADGRILVLRPDITMPIARIAATKLKSAALPMRISYVGNVYRNQKAQSGKQCEIAQAGIELLGVEGPEADAEVIATAVQACLDIGIKEFQVDIGQVEFFKGLVEQAGMDETQSEQIRSLIDQKNMLALELLLKDSMLSDDIKNIFCGLPTLYGNGDMLKDAAGLSHNSRCREAIGNIREVYEILKDFGFDKYLTFDLGMVQSFNFYTGIIFRGITAELGYPICGGGRYDRLVSEFGFDLPATGFAIGIKRLLMVLERQQNLEKAPGVDVLVAFEGDGRKKALELMKTLRDAGQRVELFMPVAAGTDPTSYANKKSIAKLIVVNKDEFKEMIDI